MVSNPSLRTEAFQANVAAAVNQKKPLAANVWQACSIVSKYAQPVNRSSKTNEHHINNMDEEDSTEWLAHHPLGTDLIHSMLVHAKLLHNSVVLLLQFTMLFLILS